MIPYFYGDPDKVPPNNSTENGQINKETEGGHSPIKGECNSSPGTAVLTEVTASHAPTFSRNCQYPKHVSVDEKFKAHVLRFFYNDRHRRRCHYSALLHEQTAWRKASIGSCIDGSFEVLQESIHCGRIQKILWNDCAVREYLQQWGTKHVQLKLFHSLLFIAGIPAIIVTPFFINRLTTKFVYW